MEKIIERIIKHKKLVLSIFILIFIICLACIPRVKINYNLMDYLPNESNSTEALNIMDKEFGTAITNTRVMLKGVTISEALEYKEKIAQIDGVTEITFLDDEVSSSIPLETIPTKTLETWYKDNNAIFNIVVDEDKQTEAIENIENVISNKGIMSGSAVSTVYAEKATSEEIITIFAIVVPVILIILLLTTSSWYEPFLFLITIGVAIVINMGTNIFLGEISFVTKAAASLLQLAVSIDYSIFLLHRFAEYRKENLSVEDSMKKAMKSSFSSIASSGLTTVIGFAALILMKFKIGPDMGIVMAKAIVCSLLSVLMLLPVLSIYSYKLIDKTHHKQIIPSFHKFGEVISKLRKPILILFLILIIPCYLASGHNAFTYGSSKVLSEETEYMKNTEEIENTFGKSNTIVLMVPNGDFPRETELINELKQNSNITSVISYVTSVGESVPTEYVPESTLKLLISENYSRIIINVNVPDEGTSTFNLIDSINEIASKYYSNYHLAGSSVSSYDLKDIVTIDNSIVNATSIILIALIILLTFRSFSIPLILLMTIESSIWFNLTYWYFTSGQLSYIAYLIISSIQLGATIDYAILFTENYLSYRKTQDSKTASISAINGSFISILTSSSILMICGFLLGLKSSNTVISQLGLLIGRGALISTILVILVLPGLLILFDKLVMFKFKKK